MAKPTLSKLTISLPKSVNEALHKAAEDRDVSPSKLAAKAIEKYIEGLRPLGAILETTWDETASNLEYIKVDAEGAPASEAPF